MKSTWIVGVSALVLASGLAGCGTPTPDTVSAEESLAIGVLGTTAVDYQPGYALGGFSPSVDAVFDTLLVRGVPEAGEPRYVPWLATEWSFTDETMTVMDIKIRDDVDFSDGEHLDARAVKASWDALIANEVSPVSIYFKGTYDPEVEVTGEYSLTITFSAPAPASDPWGALGTVPIMSPRSLEDPDSLSAEPVGSGPYILDQEASTPGVEYRFTRNPDYWNAESFPYDVLSVKQFADGVAALNALKAGQIDATAIDATNAANVESEGFAVTVGYGQYRMLFFGDRNGETLAPIADVRVRRAINLAFDRESIDEVLDLGYGRASSQPFQPGQAEYLEGEDDRYAYDLDEARELMAEAGYADGFDVTIPTEPGLASMEPVVQQSLADIGIRTTFEPFVDAPSYSQGIQSGAFPILMGPMYYVNTVPSLLADATYGSIPWGYDMASFERLFDRTQNGSEESKAAASQELGRLLLDEAWYAPFSTIPTVWASDPAYTVRINDLASAPLRLISPAV